MIQFYGLEARGAVVNYRVLDPPARHAWTTNRSEIDEIQADNLLTGTVAMPGLIELVTTHLAQRG